jgi:predicted kinase
MPTLGTATSNEDRGPRSRYARNVATLHFIYGWPGAGKTTLARALGERERAVVFCEDEWLATLATERITSLQQYVESSARIRRLIAPLARRLLALGVSVVFDFAGNTPSHRAWVKGIADAMNADHLLHVLDVPAERVQAASARAQRDEAGWPLLRRCHR